jgi:hypothetical protein
LSVLAGDPLRPTPSALAAIPPWPGIPVGFSKEIDRERRPGSSRYGSLITFNFMVSKDWHERAAKTKKPPADTSASGSQQAAIGVLDDKSIHPRPHRFDIVQNERNLVGGTG